MKRKQQEEATIALDVKDAMRARAEAEHAEVLLLKRKLEEEDRADKRALEKSRKEKLATFYYGLATLFMASSGIGGLTPIIADSSKSINWLCVVINSLISLFFGYEGNKQLK